MSNPAAIFKNSVDISNNSNLIIHSGGNLGIGVTNPSTHFDVDGSGNFSGNLDVNGTINTQNFIVNEDSNFGSSSSDLATFNSKIIAKADIDLSENQIINCRKINLKNSSDGGNHTGALEAETDSIKLSGFSNLIFTIDNNDNDTNGIFKINCNSDSGPSLVEVNQSSQMGIGKTPSKELDVSGDGKFSGDLDVSGTISGNGSGLSYLNATNISSGTLSMGRIADSSITNTKLQNKLITIAGTDVSLGNSISDSTLKNNLGLGTTGTPQFARIGLGKAYDSDFNFSLDTNNPIRIRATPVDQSYNNGPERGVLVLHSSAGIGKSSEGGNSNFSIEPSGNILTLSRDGGSGASFPLGCILNLSRWENPSGHIHTQSRSRLAFRLNHIGDEYDEESDYNTAMVICSNNSVGIGTTNPSTNLDVDGSGNFSGNLDVSGIIKTNGLKGYTINNFSFEDFEGTDYDLTVNVDHVFEMGHQHNPGANFMCDSNSNGVSGSEVPEGFAFYSRGGNSDEIDDNYPRLLMYITGVSGNTGIRGNLVLGREQRHDSGSYKLDVNGDGNFEEDLNVGGKIIGNIEKSDSALNIKTTTSGAINITSVAAVNIQSGSSKGIIFKTDGDDDNRMRITNTGNTFFYGNVTIEDDKNLEMSGNGTFTTGTGPVSLNGNVTIASGKNLTVNGSGSFIGTIQIDKDTNNNDISKILGKDEHHAIYIGKGYDGTSNDVLDFHEYGKIRFFTGNQIHNQTEKMCILSGGNVGIGTNNPSEKLEVSGNLHLDNGITGNNKAGARLIFDNAYNKRGPNKISFHSTNKYGFGVESETVSYHTSQDHKFYSGVSYNGIDNASDTPNMTISSGGKVGIGKTPSTHLDVSGDGNFEGDLTVGGTITGDVTGNAATATKLENTITIGNVNFDGGSSITPKNINIAHTNAGGDHYLLFSDDKTGNRQPKTNDSIKIIPVDGKIIATEFHGDGSNLTNLPLSSFWSGSSGSDICYNSGNVGIGTNNPSTKLEVNGTVKATNYIATSDRNLKENIVALEKESVLEKVSKLNGYHFNFKNDETKQTKSGLIAQEVEEVMPELVMTNETNQTKTMDYSGMIPYLVECIKVQKTQIESQQDLLQIQQTQINMLKEKIENM